MTIDLDRENPGFAYHKLPLRYISYYKDSKWGNGQLAEDATPHISKTSPASHYDQQAFEGLKVCCMKDGSVQLFRPNMNAERLQRIADHLLMPQVPTEKSTDAAKQVMRANEELVPPYGTGAALYLRPLSTGIGDIIGAHLADEYVLTIFVMPVGNYFKGNLVPTNFLIRDECDRAASNGTRAAKVGGNHAASSLPGEATHDRKLSNVVYLDSTTHIKVEEVGSTGFFGITVNNGFIVPLSPSILSSITKYSLFYLVEYRLGVKAIRGDVKLDGLGKFIEAGACSAAAVISLIGDVQHEDDFHVFYGETEVDPVTRKFYDELVGIQFGDTEAPEGWVYKVG